MRERFPTKERFLILILILIVTAVIWMGCVQPEPKPDTKPVPSPPVPSQPPKKLKLMEIEPTKEKEQLPPEYFPPSLPWRLFKGDERSAMYYPSYVPRKPEVEFKVELSANLGGELATPVVSNLIILADHQRIYALNRENGEIVWSKDIYDEFNRFVEAYGKGEFVYLATSSTPGGGGKPILIALNDDGKLQWSVEFGERGSRTTSNLIIANGAICLGINDNVYCFSEKGETLWSGYVGGNVRGLAYGGGKLFVSSENQNVLYAFDIKTGERLWQYENDAVVGTPLFKEKILFVDGSGKVVCLDEGEVLWKRNFGIGQDANSNSLLAAGTKIFASRRLGDKPLSVMTIGFDGEKVGEFRLESDEEPGTPLVTEDIVLLPVSSTEHSRYSKIYVLWRGLEKLDEIKIEGEEIFMPRIAVANGEIYTLISVNRSKAILYKLSDKEEPEIKDIEVGLNEGKGGKDVEGAKKGIEITATLRDERSGIYKPLVVYSINRSDWRYLEMHPVRKYFKEPLGGYGLGEEPYEAKIQIAPNSTIEFYIAAIDKVGNAKFSDVYAFKLVWG
jgi:outer membrane protein assembly factor BamB